MLLAHPVSQGALVTTLLLWAMRNTLPPQRAATVFALPSATSAVLPSSAVTLLKLPNDLAELLLVALTVLKLEPALLAVLPFRATAVFPVSKPRAANAVLLSSAIAVFSSNPPDAA